MNDLSEEDQLMVTTIASAAMSYYLYRIAGCPYGDSMSGLNAWNAVQIEAFNQLVTREHVTGN